MSEEGQNVVEEGDVEELKSMIKSRLTQLSDSVLSGIDSEDQRLLEEKQKLREAYAKLEDWAGGIPADEELKDSTKELLEETAGLMSDLAEHPGAQHLVQRASALFGNNDQTSQLFAKVEEKLSGNKATFQELFRKAPSLLESLNENIATVGEHAASNMTIREWLEVLEEKSKGVVKIKGDQILVNGEEDSKLGELLKNKAGGVLVPMIKEKASGLTQKLRDMRKDKHGQAILEKGLEFLSEKEKMGASLLGESMSADAMIDWGEKLVNDAEVRSEMIEKVKDMVLDFLISYLPNVSIPPIEGDKEGLLYRIENLDLGGFKLKKEFVSVELNGLEQIQQGAHFFLISVRNVQAELKNIKWEFKQDYFPRLSGSGAADAWMSNGSVEIGLHLVKTPLEEGDSPPATGTDGQENPENVKDEGTKLWKPQLLLGSCEVDIETIDVSVKDSQFSWLYNTMSELFADSLRMYIVSLLQDTMVEHFSSLSENLNSFVSGNWPMVASYLDVNITQLPDISVAEQFVAKARLEKLARRRKDVYSVAFPEEGQIGIVFVQHKEFVVVKDFRRGPNNNLLPAEKGGEVRVGDILVAFNGQQVTSLPLERVMDKLRRAGRPLHLTFMVPTESQKQRGQGSSPTEAPSFSEESIVDLIFTEAKLYLVILSRNVDNLDFKEPNGFSALVKGFRKKEDGSKGAAEASGLVKEGMIIVGVNGYSTQGLSFNEVHELLRLNQARPLKLRFARDPEYVVEFKDESPSDIRVSCLPGNQIVVTGFTSRKGPGELQCAEFLQKGDVVRAINGTPVEAGNFTSVVKQLKTVSRPVLVSFGRPGTSIDLCSATFQDGPLGMIFYRSPESNVAFKAFSDFPGPAKACGKIEVGHILLCINEEVPTPSEAEIQALLDNGTPISLKLRDMTLQEFAVKDLKAWNGNQST